MILITNDDGVDAPGIEALETAVRHWGDWTPVIVAPATVQSGCSHLTTMNTPIKVEQRGENRYAVHGSPADCVRLGLAYFAQDAAWVVSGINEGGNLGHDIYLSGTVGAAREAAFHGVRAVAFSQYFHEGFPLNWERAVDHAHRVLGLLEGQAWQRGRFWNANFPHRDDAVIPEVHWTEPCRTCLPIEYKMEGEHYRYQRGRYQGRDQVPGTDVTVCFGGGIAISTLEI
ncbi:MAG: 5'/3'-nucleotidase SurE [Candidatus Hydrogenedentes bacterium]|nr:5'/3'-nucleotidase SurE [Candidatus Hydrogenedentota bacterium]